MAWSNDYISLFYKKCFSLIRAHHFAAGDYSLHMALGFPGGSNGKESTCNVGDLGSMPALGRYPGGGHSNLLQCISLENPHRQKSLAGYSPQGCKELDTTERLSTALENSKWELFLIALLFPVTF